MPNRRKGGGQLRPDLRLDVHGPASPRESCPVRQVPAPRAGGRRAAAARRRARQRPGSRRRACRRPSRWPSRLTPPLLVRPCPRPHAGGCSPPGRPPPARSLTLMQGSAITQAIASSFPRPRRIAPAAVSPYDPDHSRRRRCRGLPSPGAKTGAGLGTLGRRLPSCLRPSNPADATIPEQKLDFPDGSPSEWPGRVARSAWHAGCSCLHGGSPPERNAP